MKRGNWGFVSGLALLCLPLVVFSVSCGGNGGDNGDSTGTLNLSLTDQATTDYKAIYVTIEQVEVHKEGGGGWQVVPLQFEKKTVNLLDLVNGVREELAIATLATGHYTQMRLILGDKPDDSLNILSRRHPHANYFIDLSDKWFELKVPSGFQTGIKIVKGFNINENQTTELLLDFDATKSIVKAGSSGQWLLKPTIKLLNTKECSIISGNAVQGGVLVSAQVYDATPNLAEELRVEVEAATVTDASGNYKLFLSPGSYTLVGYKDGFFPSFETAKFVTEAGKTYTKNFSLSASSTGTLISGPITISGADQEQYATISIRQDATVSGNTEQIEVKSRNVANGGSLTDTILPAANYTYTAVISTYGKTTQVFEPFTISVTPPTDLGPVVF